MTFMWRANSDAGLNHSHRTGHRTDSTHWTDRNDRRRKVEIRSGEDLGMDIR